MTRIRIATRGSRLALWQAERVSSLLAAQGVTTELVTIRTTGDRRTDVPLSAIGGKGMFVKELEEALLSDRADIAVHSLKDVPSILPDPFVLCAFPEREDPRDAWLQLERKAPSALPPGTVVATGSPRRASQLRMRWPHLKITGLRGNVDTRLGALSNGTHEAMLLAMAGLRRLGVAEEIRVPLAVSELIPAAGQGVLAIEIVRGRDDVAELVAKLSNPGVEREALTERRVLQGFGTQLDCHSAIAVHAARDGERLRLYAYAGSPDGSEGLTEELEGGAAEWQSLADEVHRLLSSRGALELMNRGID